MERVRLKVKGRGLKYEYKQETLGVPEQVGKFCVLHAPSPPGKGRVKILFLFAASCVKQYAAS
jgi:hypothetical protein